MLPPDFIRLHVGLNRKEQKGEKKWLVAVFFLLEKKKKFDDPSNQTNNRTST
jgi:hypothetical protein